MRFLTLLGLFITLSLGAAQPVLAQIKVLTSFTVFADMARNVAGEHAEVVSITREGAEIHMFRPTPGDIKRGLGADVALWNGMGLETWFERYLENLGNVKAYTLSDGVEPILITEDAYQGRANPHGWMSPGNANIYIDNIVTALSETDPANADAYAANGEAYKAEIAATFAPIRAAIEALPEDRRWLVTSEAAFSYLARDFGLKEASIWAINADSQGSPQQVRRIIDLINENNIPVIFSESTVSPKPAEQVARETGIAYGGVLYVDSLSTPDGPVPTYLDLLKVTSQTIVTGLTAQP
ncbi:MAG: metal ABC transporter substrate-binding protein [Hoeflea sp.]|uniref:metal ABC transporter substrate-binding protein n=1 Tax=Hoeflea sp. TaxID=1940281 RepID=UPI001D33FAEB|nr:metal ABC transporter substrate-binding protein [Hoeflea sp.]MBU4528890.1 metal ABC transporter substrate-binding protein [Alphaproteobacteria bacterium]MBU4544023.1 metal ABC transporter substrate-binding protein [Alphaproteobacteria bacterium]MBU4551892.1 metal ABC transporter substrate-binding protein [Alphaproteobacteria bacterium]MBV1723357.1 metal ABC transporter substrate-binding protein [Hoeflea sp.]MBV1760336.1 metal ABC transporter substrate-binding protein [Hoeflea sp.]